MRKFIVTRGGVILPKGQVLDTGAEFDPDKEGVTEAWLDRYVLAKKIAAAPLTKMAPEAEVAKVAEAPKARVRG